MIYPVTGWLKIKQYDKKIAISIENLVDTILLARYHRQTGILYDQGS